MIVGFELKNKLRSELLSMQQDINALPRNHPLHNKMRSISRTLDSLIKYTDMLQQSIPRIQQSIFCMRELFSPYERIFEQLYDPSFQGDRETLIKEVMPVISRFGVNIKHLNKLREYLGHILDSGRVLLVHVNAVIDIARIETKNHELDITLCHLRDLVLTLPIDNGVKFKNDIPEDMNIMADKRQIQSVITNLIGNAVKYTKEGHIKISADQQIYKDRNFTIITVEDTGKGISPEMLATVTHRFVCGPEVTAGNVEGSGIGLAHARAIIESHGGFLRIESNNNPQK